MTDYLDPWSAIEKSSVREALENRLHREMPPMHALQDRSLRAVARRIDDDDVLFELDGGPEHAIVHLVYAKSIDPKFPYTTFFNSFEEFALAMRHDADGE